MSNVSDVSGYDHRADNGRPKTSEAYMRLRGLRQHENRVIPTKYIYSNNAYVVLTLYMYLCVVSGVLYRRVNVRPRNGVRS